MRAIAPESNEMPFSGASAPPGMREKIICQILLTEREKNAIINMKI